MRSRLRPSLLSGLLLCSGLACTAPAAAQSGNGFLFSEPSAVLSMHGGFSRPSAGGDLFTTITDLFTLAPGDFAGFTLGGSIVSPLNERVLLGLSGFYASRSSRSEYRDWVDQDDLPIEQTTSFLRLPILAIGRVYLSPRGEKIGNLAWIPSRYAPYVGAGAGLMWHRFRIVGDMFDYDDPNLEIYSSALVDTGWSPAFQVMAGVDINLSTRLLLTGEASYIRSSAELGQSFADFEDPLDLSGFMGTVGLSVRL
jgi:hypothetical protein